MKDLLKLKADIGADVVSVNVYKNTALVSVVALRDGKRVAHSVAFSVETLTAFIGDPWLIVREGLRDFATANDKAEVSE